MREIKKFIIQLDLLILQKIKFAVATIVFVDGSAYYRPGARMLINENGEWYGSISGGCLEGDMLKKAQMSMITCQNKLIKYDTREDDPFELGVGLGCNGLIEIIINPDLEYAKRLSELLKIHIETNESSLLEHVFNLNSGSESNLQLQSFDALILKSTKDDLDKFKEVHQSTIKLSENRLSFSEYLPAQPRLVLYGNSFDSKSLIELCVFLSWDIFWVGNPLKMNLTSRSLVQSFFHWDDEFTFKKNDSIVLMTHDFDRDLAILGDLIAQNFSGYIGVLGPLTRMQKIKKQLGFLSVKLDRNNLFAPIGLDIGAEGPNEIAISIISEIIAFKNSRIGESLKFRTNPIHTN